MAIAVEPDPYSWWVGRSVDILTSGPGSWRRGQVLEAAHALLYDMGSDVGHWYEADEGESDGHGRVIVLEAGADPIDFEIYPGGPFGVFPYVTPARDWSRDAFAWWQSLSSATKAQLGLEPGKVPPEVLPEVVRSGAGVAGIYWPETQSGPDSFDLSAYYASMVQDMTLLRAYEVAQDAYDKMFAGLNLSAGPLSAVPAEHYHEAVRVIRRRDITKVALDAHRVALDD